MKPLVSISRLTLVALATLVLHAAPALGSTELVKNGLFTEGRDGKPSHWRNDMYAADASRMTWTVGDNGLGVLEIDSTKQNDARWVQNVPVSPNTWYQVTGWLRAEDVGGQAMGIYLSVMDTFHNSRDLRGTSGWQPVSFWVKTGGLETSLQLACRLGGYSSLNTGRGWCAGLSVAAAGAPQSRDSFVYGGTVSESSGSGDLPIAQGVAVLVVIGILLLAWRYLTPPSARIPR